MHTETLRAKVLELRRAGYSYSDISSRTGLSKSTLSGWLASVPYSPNKETRERIGKAIAAANAQKIKIRQDETEEIRKSAKKEIGKISERDLLMFGLGLYLGEGAKTHDIVRVTNSDSDVIRAAVAWFNNLGVRREQFAPRMHLYPDSDKGECLKYWSGVTKIPKKQFLKTQIDTRLNKASKNKRKLPYGTLHVGVRSGGRKEFGVRFHRKIQAWNKAILNEIYAGLV